MARTIVEADRCRWEALQLDIEVALMEKELGS